jgi:hypothetical protein
MNDAHDIIITNKADDNNISINYSDKNINASDIFNIINYQENDKYKIESNIDEITEKNLNEYFKDFLDVMNSIIDEINKIDVELPKKDDSLIQNDNVQGD